MAAFACADMCFLMHAHLEPDIRKCMTSYATDSDRVKTFTTVMGRINLLPQNKIVKNKTEKESLQLRNLGNKAYENGNDKEAHQLYTKSIATAPFPTELELETSVIKYDALAIALANRSAVLFRGGKYESCLKDISQALKYKYPEHLFYKLFERQGRCLQNLGRKKEAMESLNNALKWLTSAAGLTRDKQNKIKDELQKLLKCLKNSKISVKLASNESAKPPTCSYGKNHQIPSASDCVEMKYYPEMGRGLSATRDIQPGDIIIVEKSFASYLSPTEFETHCFNCLEHSEMLLPCSFCTTVMYCSEECRSLSWNNNHCIDCSLLPTLLQLGYDDVDLLALKVVIIVCKNMGLDNMLASLKAEESLEPKKRGFDHEGHYSSSNYSPIYWLQCNTEKRKFSDLFQRCVRAARLLHCLETLTDFFSYFHVKNFKYEVGGLLLRHQLNISCNSSGVVEYIPISMQTQEKSSPHVVIGAAIYATGSLLNHSCFPNVLRQCFSGDIQVLYAIRPISAGEQVFDDYGTPYEMMEKTNRISKHEYYYFTCKCIACVEDWPTSKSFLCSVPTFICDSCKHVLAVSVSAAGLPEGTTICANCNKVHNIRRICEKLALDWMHFQQILQVVAANDSVNWNEVIQKIIPYMQFLDKHVKWPSFDQTFAHQFLKTCIHHTGNLHKP